MPAAHTLCLQGIDTIGISFDVDQIPRAVPRCFPEVLFIFLPWINRPSLARQFRRSSFHSARGWLRHPDRLRRQCWRQGRPRTNIQAAPHNGGCSHCATNWQAYVEQLLENIGAEPLLRNTASAERHGYAPQQDNHPLTKFENRGTKLGHGVWDLVFKRI